MTGALDPDEMDAVREHLADCEDAHAELLELGEAATALLETVEPAEPPAALKERVMAAAAEDLAEGRHPAAAPRVPAPAVASAPSSQPVDLDVERARRRARFAWILAAAAIIVAVVLGGSNLLLRNDLSAAQAYRTGVEQVLDLAAQPGSVTALLTGQEGAVSGLGAVGSDGTVRIAMRGLPPTTGTQVYTAWSIAGDAAPVPIGDFTVGADGVAVASARAPTAAAGLRARAHARALDGCHDAHPADRRRRRDEGARRLTILSA